MLNCSLKTSAILFLNITIFLFLPTLPENSFAINDARLVSEIGIDEKLGNKIETNIFFFDQDGNRVLFEELFADDLPVVLSPVYFSCPRVCTFTTDGVLETLNGLESLSLGKDFKLVSFSFNPEDKPELAKEKAEKYEKSLIENHVPNKNWYFLTGDSTNINKLTDEIGFKFKKDGEEYAHPTALIVLTPDAGISRYLYGIEHNPRDLKLALVEASDGNIGNSRLLNKVLLFCYQFDPDGKKYALQALNVVKAGGALTLLLLSGFLAYFWIREKKGSQ